MNEKVEDITPLDLVTIFSSHHFFPPSRTMDPERLHNADVRILDVYVFSPRIVLNTSVDLTRVNS